MLRPFQIRHIVFDNPTVMAPMAGITDMPFRMLVKQNGCGLVCSEMLSANGLWHGSGKTRQMMTHKPFEKPISIQIFGAKPDTMAEGARMVEAAGADILDINFGCSVKKIMRGGAGAALMQDMKAAEAVIRAVRAAVSIPLTIKIRSGWEPSGEDAMMLSRMAQDCGVDAIAVHPRTIRQKFTGSANWEVIAAVKQQLSIPVIGNGDIRSAADALQMMAQTQCDAVMVGREALRNPWIFSQIQTLADGGNPIEPGVAHRFAAIKRYIGDMVDCYGELHACRIMRSRLGWLLKGLPHASRFRDTITRISSLRETEDLLDAYQMRLEQDFENPLSESA